MIKNSKQRAYLKGLAMNMTPIIQIGKSSVTPELTQAVEEALEARELIKISVLQNCLDDPRQMAEVLAERFRDINPELELTVLPVYLKDEAIPELLDSAAFDFVVDAIDTVAPKCYLIYHALQRGLKIVSSMGAGAKRDITQIRFADLWDTYHCGLSKAVRKRLQKMGMKRKLPVVFSTEQADANAVILVDDEQNKKSTAGTVSYMPAVFGCYLAEYVIRKL